MKAAVLTCSSLKMYVEAAMESQKIMYEILLIDRIFHAEPEKMKQEVAKVIETLPKETGHLYLYEQDPSDFSALRLMSEEGFGMPHEYARISREMLFQMYFGQYHHLDIIDTGMNDCYSESYVLAAQEYADQIGAALDYVPGSNRMLEKLLTGKWDEQFLIAEPGHLIRYADFF